jgi:hypothetical protein
MPTRSITQLPLNNEPHFWVVNCLHRYVDLTIIMEKQLVSVSVLEHRLEQHQREGLGYWDTKPSQLEQAQIHRPT